MKIKTIYILNTTIMSGNTRFNVQNNIIKMKKIIIFTVLLLTTRMINAQSGPDIGVLISQEQRTRLNLEYRHTLKGKYKSIIGLNAGNIGSIFPVSKWVVNANDSVVTYKVHGRLGNQYGVKIGVDKQLYESFFSVGACLGVNYRTNNQWIGFQKVVFDETDNSWKNDYDLANSNDLTTYYPYGLDNPGNNKVYRSYIVPRLDLRFSANVELIKHIYFNMFINTHVSLPVLIGESIIGGVDNDFKPGSKVSNTEMSTNIGIGLRYVFGKDEKDKIVE